MSFKKAKIDLAPVWLVSARDPALEWGAETPPAEVIPYAEAPIKPGERPDVLVCRPLNWAEAKAVNIPLSHDQSAAAVVFAQRMVLEFGLVEIRLDGAAPVSSRDEMWELIQAHQVDEQFIDEAIRWIVRSTQGNPLGRFPRAEGAPSGGDADGESLRAGLRAMSAREAMQ